MKVQKSDLMWGPPGEEVAKSYPNGMLAIKQPQGVYTAYINGICIISSNWWDVVRQSDELDSNYNLQ